MTNPGLDNRSAFSLVEVALALAVAAFCLVALVGLLPVGINSNHAVIEQAAAAGIAQAIASDLRATSFPPLTGTPPSTISSPAFQIPVPVVPISTTVGSSAPGPVSHTFFLMEDGSEAATGMDHDANLAANPLYRATVTLLAPATGSLAATTAQIFVTWPAAADPSAGSAPTHFSGQFEALTAINRN